MNVLNKVMPRGRWGLLRLAAVVALAVAGLSLAHPAEASDTLEERQWIIKDHSMPAGTLVEPGYQFKMTSWWHGGKMLARKSQTFGIDLDFITDPGNGFEGIKFEHQSGSGPIKFGEPIAIYVVNGGYLKYTGQAWSVDLGYSSTPAYEWILYGAALDTPVTTGQAISLRNIPRRAYLVGQLMPFGINLNFY